MAIEILSYRVKVNTFYEDLRAMKKDLDRETDGFLIVAVDVYTEAEVKIFTFILQSNIKNETGN